MKLLTTLDCQSREDWQRINRRNRWLILWREWTACGIYHQPPLWPHYFMNVAYLFDD